MREHFDPPPRKRRAKELYGEDTPFRQKIVERKDLYRRKPKHRNKGDYDE